MKDQDQKTKKTKSLKAGTASKTFAEAFELDLLEVDKFYTDDLEELDFDLEDPIGDSF